MAVVRDPRYSLDKYLRGLGPLAALKQQLLAQHLVRNFNSVYGWGLSEDGNWIVEQTNNLMYEIVLAPGYNQERFLAAIATGEHP
jgi:hypothetical protein